MKTISVAYLAALTLLLLCRDPLGLVGMPDDLPQLLDRLFQVTHFVSFAVAALLVFAARWGAPAWAVVGLLAAYAGATELLQGLVESRSPEWSDWLQDVAGIAAGAGIWWWALKARRRIAESGGGGKCAR